jgi:hypothetical protein
VTCDICKDSSDSTVKTKDKGTTNLFSHLKNHHPKQYAEVAKVSLKKSSSNDSCTSKLKTKKNKGSAQPTLTQSIERHQPYSKESERYRTLLESITQFLVSGLSYLIYFMHNYTQSTNFYSRFDAKNIHT